MALSEAPIAMLLVYAAEFFAFGGIVTAFGSVAPASQLCGSEELQLSRFHESILPQPEYAMQVVECAKPELNIVGVIRVTFGNTKAVPKQFEIGP